MKTRIATDDRHFEVVVPSNLWAAVLQRAEELQDETETDAMILSCVEMMSLIAKLMDVLKASDHLYCVTQVK